MFGHSNFHRSQKGSRNLQASRLDENRQSPAPVCRPPLCQLTWIPLQLPSAPSCRPEHAPCSYSPLSPPQSITHHKRYGGPGHVAVLEWPNKVYFSSLTVCAWANVWMWELFCIVVHSQKYEETKGHNPINKSFSVFVFMWEQHKGQLKQMTFGQQQLGYTSSTHTDTPILEVRKSSVICNFCCLDALNC